MNVNGFISNKKIVSVSIVVSLFVVSLAYVNVNAQILTSATFDQAHVPVATWGKYGDKDGRFDQPKSITVDNKGFVYVVDAGNARVQKFADRGRFIAQIGGMGDEDGQFKRPYGIALDSKANIYVTDQIRNNVQVFTDEGNFTTSWGKLGARAGEFRNPTGIAIDSEDNVYVVDNGNKRVQKFSIDGKFILEWGSYGPGNGQFVDPFSINADAFGAVYVIDTADNRVQKFTKTGKFIDVWSNDKNGLLESASSVASDQDGNVYVSDGYNSRVQKFNMAGILLEDWTHDKDNFPISSIAVDSLGYIYVTDDENSRIVKFGTISSTWSGLGNTMKALNKKLDRMVKGSVSETILIPSSVHGTLVVSGEGPDVFGDVVVMGHDPSISVGDSAKITGITIQNKDAKSGHKVRIQLGYEDVRSEFAVRQDLKVVLKTKGVLGDAVTLSLPQPFFVPTNQIEFGGTNILLRIAADSSEVPVEVSASGILNP